MAEGPFEMAHAGNVLDPFVGRGRIVLVLLLAINILNFIDRQLPFILSAQSRPISS